MPTSSDSEAEAFADAAPPKKKVVKKEKAESSNAKKKRKDAEGIKDEGDNKAPKKRRVATEMAMSKIRDMQRGDQFAESESSSSSEDESIAKKVSKGPDKPSSSKSASLLSMGGGFRSKSDGNKAGGSLRKRTSRLGDREWESAARGEQRLASVNKAIDRVYEMSLADENFELFGNDMIQCFYDVATVTGEPIRSKTLKYVEHLANRWKYTVMQEGWKDDDDTPTPSEVIDVIIGMYCMERVGIRHDVKTEVLAFMNSDAAYQASDYFGGWDPKVCSPPLTGNIEVTSNEPISRCRAFSNSLIHAFYADRVGLSLGCSFSDIFQWLPTLRPYKGAHEMDYQEYIDQCYMITHIIFTSNNWGELSLDPALFPHEYFFIQANFDIHLQQRDVHLIAEFMECMRCFGCRDDNDLIKRGTSALLGLQLDNGIWDPSDEPYRTYHATMCGAQALLAHRYRGFGPGIPSVSPLLLKWARDDAMKNVDYRSEAATFRIESDARKQIYVRTMKKRCGVDDSADSSAPQSSAGGIEWPDGSMDTRVNDLKGILRGTAKKFSAAASGGAAEVVPAAKTEVKKPTEVAPPETKDPVVLEKERITIELGILSKSLQTYLRNGASQKHIENLEELLTAAKSLKVTASILQGHQVAKDIKAASKGRGGRSRITAVAGEVMTAWKVSMSAAGPAKSEEKSTETTDHDPADSNQADNVSSKSSEQPEDDSAMDLESPVGEVSDGGAESKSGEE